MVLFIIYAYYQEYAPKYAKKSVNLDAISGTNSEKPATEPKESAISEKVISKIRENETGKVVLEALARKAVEDKYGKGDMQIIAARETGSLTIIDIIYGEGETLNCGAKAVINYDAFLSSGIKFDATRLKDESSPITIRTGGGQVIKGLEAGIVGMKVGGKRKISIPAELAFNNPKFTNNLVSKGEVVTYNVELMEIKSGPYQTKEAIQTLQETPGTGYDTLCGDKVKVKYAFSKINDEAISGAEGEIEFVVGNGEVPMGLEFATIDMQKNGKKTVEIPNELLKVAEKNTLPVNLPNGEAVKVNIDLIDILSK